MRTTVPAALLTASLLAATSALSLTGLVSAEAAGAKKYANCTAMHKDYPHGVGKKGAKDKTSGKPVTTFTVSNSLYKANTKSDRDSDGIACEQR